MFSLRGVVKDYGWGDTDAVPRLLRRAPTGGPVAELWFGDHPAGPARLADVARREHTAHPGHTGHAGPADLAQLVASDPEGVLGLDVLHRFGPHLPYLLKLIAPAKPLSLQVHPSLERAQARWAQEHAAGLEPHERNYHDSNHKPEIVYALTRFEALCGFRAPRRARELVAGLDTPLARRLATDMDAPRAGRADLAVRRAFERLLCDDTRPGPALVDEVAHACRRRLASGDSPSPRVDRIVTDLHEEFSGDPGVVASLLLNPVTLRPGEALFVPAGAVHAYLSGLAVELQASSDNVLRAGLTTKRVDVPEMLEAVDFVAAPPIRIAPEVREATRTYYAPVDDFELAVTELSDGAEELVRGRGPRVLLVLGGDVELRTSGEERLARHGEAVFVRADEGEIHARAVGTGRRDRGTDSARDTEAAGDAGGAGGAGGVRIVQADVP